MSSGTSFWEASGDYRARATRGVTIAALLLMLPMTVFAFFRGHYVPAFGGLYITIILVINTLLIARGRNHEPMTMIALVPGGIVCMALAFLVDANLAGVWCFPAIVSCYCMLSRRKALTANIMIMAVAIPMMWSALAVIDAARLTASLMCVSLFANILVREIDAQQQRLRYQLDHDPLTGLLNRTSLKSQLQSAISALRISSTPAALLAIDLDHFKSVNDLYGHEAGDLVLCEVARLLKKHVSGDGAAFRLGGEEFLIMLADNDKYSARKRADMVRLKIAQADILPGHPVTASIGIASLRNSDDWQSWTRRSDYRLYSAKHRGRNCVVCEGEKGIEQTNPVNVGLGSKIGDRCHADTSQDANLVDS